MVEVRCCKRGHKIVGSNIFWRTRASERYKSCRECRNMCRRHGWIGPPSWVNRLFSNILSNLSSNECWEWQGSLREEYGRISIGGESWLVHRLVFLLCYGNLPSGFDVLHKCDNPPCCNPDHLFLGNELDNYRDAKSKDRHTRGERQGNSKLTDNIVRAIRRSSLHPDILAAKFRVAPITIRHVKCGRSWQHVR